MPHKNPLHLQNASVRPLVGESVLVLGVIMVFGSPIKYDGKKLLVLAFDGLDGLPSVIGSILSRKLNCNEWKCHEHNQTFDKNTNKKTRMKCNGLT